MKTFNQLDLELSSYKSDLEFAVKMQEINKTEDRKQLINWLICKIKQNAKDRLELCKSMITTSKHEKHNVTTSDKLQIQKETNQKDQGRETGNNSRG